MTPSVQVYYQNEKFGSSDVDVLFPDDSSVPMHQCLNGWNYFQITSIESNPWVIFQQANVEGTVYDNDDCLSGVNYYIPFNISNPSVSIVTGLSGCNGTINTSFGQELLPLFLFSSESSRFCLAPTPDVVGSSCIFELCFQPLLQRGYLR